jgi:hypothetical protein
MKHKTTDKQKAAGPKRDRRFYELLDLAAEGNEEAIHDLWLSYEYDFAKKGRDDE